MSKKLTKYDIAISFTEQDNAVAQKMATALRKKGFDVYYYKSKNQFGEHLDKVTKKVYRNRSNYGLVILSHAYRQRPWTMREWAELTDGKKRNYVKNIFIIKIDESAQLPGLKASTIYEKWNDNETEIAQRIKEQLDFPPSRFFQLIIGSLLVLLLAVGVYYVMKSSFFP